MTQYLNDSPLKILAKVRLLDRAHRYEIEVEISRFRAGRDWQRVPCTCRARSPTTAAASGGLGSAMQL
jgi:hypothetical protein